jgi:anaerobic ribonucleoside-triphosphate reductase activating protein
MYESCEVNGGPEPGTVALVQVAATCVGTRALGPGLRSVLWVQGCPFHCAGCIAPGWIPQRTARIVHPGDLADELLADPGVTGLTFSGGEPMVQAAALAEVARYARRIRALTLICFTGYRLARLRSNPPAPGVPALLDQADVLIDGRYVAALNDDRGLRGSSNQRVHFLSGRLTAARDELESGPRRAEFRFREDTATLVGVPAQAVAQAFGKVLRR